MVITIYVNHRKELVLSEKDFKKIVEEEKEDIVNDDRRFEEWLENQFCSLEIFELTDVEKGLELEKYAEYAKDSAEEYLLFEDYWKKVTLEI